MNGNVRRELHEQRQRHWVQKDREMADGNESGVVRAEIKGINPGDKAGDRAP